MSEDAWQPFITDVFTQPDLSLHTTSKELISTPEIISSDIVSVIPAYNDQEGLEITLRSCRCY